MHAPENEWDDWVRDWVMVLEGDPDVAPKTVDTYRPIALRFVAWLADEHPKVTGPDLLERRHVEAWRGSMHLAGLKPATIRTRLMAVRSWFRWMADEPGSGVGRPLPTDGVRPPTVEVEPVQVVSDGAIRALLGTCGSGSFVDLRDAAIIRMLLATGLRRTELATIDVADVDIRLGELSVMGKGRKPRVVSLSGTKAVLALSRYLRARKRQPAAAHPALFLSTRGARLTGQGIEKMLSRRCPRAGIEHVHPHQLRHTWAHHAKKAGLAYEDMERMAGWSPGSVMSRRYGASVADERARDAHRSLNLGDRV